MYYIVEILNSGIWEYEWNYDTLRESIRSILLCSLNGTPFELTYRIRRLPDDLIVYDNYTGQFKIVENPRNRFRIVNLSTGQIIYDLNIWTQIEKIPEFSWLKEGF